MRQFVTVLKKLIELSEDKELTDALNKIVVDASYTAPEAQWEIRGEQVSVALNNYLANANGSQGFFPSSRPNPSKKSVNFRRL